MPISPVSTTRPSRRRMPAPARPGTPACASALVEEPRIGGQAERLLAEAVERLVEQQAGIVLRLLRVEEPRDLAQALMSGAPPSLSFIGIGRNGTGRVDPGDNPGSFVRRYTNDAPRLAGRAHRCIDMRTSAHRPPSRHPGALAHEPRGRPRRTCSTSCAPCSATSGRRRARSSSSWGWRRCRPTRERRSTAPPRACSSSSKTSARWPWKAWAARQDDGIHLRPGAVLPDAVPHPHRPRAGRARGAARSTCARCPISTARRRRGAGVGGCVIAGGARHRPAAGCAALTGRAPPATAAPPSPRGRRSRTSRRACRWSRCAPAAWWTCRSCRRMPAPPRAPSTRWWTSTSRRTSPSASRT